MNTDERRKRLQRFAACCREQGLPLTVELRRILELILDHGDDPTPDPIYEDVRKHLPRVSPLTVCHVLDLLVGMGLMTRASSSDPAAQLGPFGCHHHLVCLHCDRLIDLEDAGLESCPQQALGVLAGSCREARCRAVALAQVRAADLSS